MTTASTLHDVFWDRLQTAIGIDVYDDEQPATPRTEMDGRVSAYAVLYAGAGSVMASGLDGAQSCLLGGAQVTCYGGDTPRSLACVDAVRAALPGVVTVNGLTRVIRAVEGGPSIPLVDPNAFPPRYYMPLDFELFAP